MYIQSLVLFIFGLVVISVDSFHTITSRRISVARAIKFTMSDENKEVSFFNSYHHMILIKAFRLLEKRNLLNYYLIKLVLLSHCQK